jgi:hypothetical protein
MDKRLDKTVTKLEAVLQEQLATHERLLALLLAKRKALAGADRAKLAELLSSENQQVQAVSELEKQRLALVAELTQIVSPDAKEPMRLPELAMKLSEPARGKLMVLRTQLRQRMESVREQTQVARRATESLVKHMQGLVQSIGNSVTGVGTYGRAGAPPKAAMAISTFSATA